MATKYFYLFFSSFMFCSFFLLDGLNYKKAMKDIKYMVPQTDAFGVWQECLDCRTDLIVLGIFNSYK